MQAKFSSEPHTLQNVKNKTQQRTRFLRKQRKEDFEINTKIFDWNLVLTNQTMLSLVLIDTALREKKKIEEKIVHKKSWEIMMGGV